MIRQAVQADLLDIVALCQRVKAQITQEQIHLWGDDYPNQEIFQYDINEKLGWVIEKDNKIIGFIALSFDIDDDFEHLEDSKLELVIKTKLLNECAIQKNQFCSLHRLMIDPAYQRQHIASFVLQSIESIIKKPIICLFTSLDNNKAIALYLKLGYEKKSIYTFPYGDMILLVKKVSS